MRETRRWINQSQPQTLYIAVFLLYINAAFLALDLLSARALPLLFVAFAVGQVAAGYGIANEKKWGYYLGIAMAFFPFALRLYVGASILGGNALSLLFEIALVALLLHPQSREHTRIWFK
jgi:hypothetical protein